MCVSLPLALSLSHTTCTRNSHRHARSYHRTGPPYDVSPFVFSRRGRERRAPMLQPREIKEDGVRFCARVQRLRVAREGGTSITRYIGQRRKRRSRSRRRKRVVGIAQGGREAGVRVRVVERQIVRHLTHLIPYLTPSPVTTLIHPFLSSRY